MTGFARRHWYAIAMIAPVAVALVTLVGFPLVRGIYLSLTDATEATVGRTIGENVIPATYDFVGLRNYLEVLSGREGDFYGILIWTVIWTAGCVFFHYTIGLGLAMLLNRQVRGRAVYRVLLILPWAVPGFVAAFAWRFLLNSQYGLFNAILHAMGVGPVGWLESPTMAKLSVIMVNTWLGVPFMMVALLGGLQAIPRELYEAAEVDGASPWQRFRHITLPGLSQVSSTVVLLGVIWTFNLFAVIFLVTGGGPAQSTEILATFAIREGFIGIRDYAMSATYGVLILSLLLVFASAYRRALRKQGELT
jgi:arabinogalactan oligomer/maltooligosaccharide transport system permease protein